jgi:type I restriction enzyme R subunit
MSRYASLDTFLRRWRSEDRKQAILEELEDAGLRLDILADEVNPELDPFDLICHVAYGQPPLTRRERANNVRKRDVFATYGPQARAVLDALLAKYQDDGIVAGLDDVRILQIPPLDRMGTTVELVRQFGGKDKFEDAVHVLQRALYEAA